MAPPDQSSTRNSVSLEFLTKLLPENFDGDRYKIRSFIKQVDSVFEIAEENQKRPLLLFVKSKIIGKAREQIDIHCNLTTWEEISELLLNLYQDRRSLDQLLEELNSISQKSNENVSFYYQKLEDLSSRILAVVHSTKTNKDILKGRIAMINDMTLNRFIYHTHPQISQMLRYREFKTLNSALTAATAEEKALGLKTNTSTKKCYICNKTNHIAKDCFHKNNKSSSQSKSINHLRSSDQQTEFSSNKSNLSCRYCKKPGHTIEQCRKRQWVNQNRDKNSNSNNQPPNQTINFQQSSQTTSSNENLSINSLKFKF